MSPRALQTIAGALVTLVGTGWAGDGYLRAGGPPVLRFQSPRTVGIGVALPPLATADPLPAEASQPPPTNPVADPVADAASPPDAGASVAVPTDAEIAASAPAGGPPAAPAPGLITPQYLLRYFLDSGSNAPSAAVLAPVSFLPPQPVNRNTSRATYSTIPP